MFLSSDCKPAHIAKNTDLIVLQSADAQCRLVSDFQEDARTKNIPILGLVDKPAQTQLKRLYELGAQECLFSTAPEPQINTRIQSLIASSQHKSDLRSLLDARVKEAYFDPTHGPIQPSPRPAIPIKMLSTVPKRQQRLGRLDARYR